MYGFSGKAESCAAMAVHIVKNRKIKRCDVIGGLRTWATVRLGVGKLVGKLRALGSLGVSIYLYLTQLTLGDATRDMTIAASPSD